jgi:hypothetical protein
MALTPHRSVDTCNHPSQIDDANRMPSAHNGANWAPRQLVFFARLSLARDGTAVCIPLYVAVWHLHPVIYSKAVRHSRKERAMNQVLVEFEKMQAENRQWDYEHSRWRVDNEAWQRDHQMALSQLRDLQDVILRHGEALQSHAESLEQADQSIRDHRRALAEYEVHIGPEQTQVTLAEDHRTRTEEHQKQLEAHERIKKHHHTVMAHLKMLRAALEEAM